MDKLGIRQWYHRRAIFQNLREPVIAPDAAYDAARGLLSLSGSWRAIGAELARVTPVLQETTQARDYRGSLGQEEKDALDTKVDEAIDYLRARHGDIAALIEGAADGLAGVELRDVILANIWPSLVSWREYALSCAALVVRRHSGPILGQNLDLGPSNNVVIAHIMPDHGPARLCHLVPGLLWLGTGVNQFGVTYGGGSVNVARAFEPSPCSLPTVFCNLALLNEVRSVADAEAVFSSFAPYSPIHDGLSLVLTDRSGSISRLESTGDDVAVLKEEGVLAAAANHFVLDGMHGMNRREDDASRAAFENSKARIARMEEAISPERANAQAIRHFLREGRGRGAWCRSAIAPDTGWTTASYVIDLGQARYHYLLGTRPAKREWRELDLEPLFQGHTYN
jgi:hypothetical protein